MKNYINFNFIIILFISFNFLQKIYSANQQNDIKVDYLSKIAKNSPHNSELDDFIRKSSPSFLTRLVLENCNIATKQFDNKILGKTFILDLQNANALFINEINEYEVWNLSENKFIVNLGRRSHDTVVCLSHNKNELILFSSSESNLEFYELKTFKSIKKLEVDFLKFNLKFSRIISISQDKLVIFCKPEEKIILLDLNSKKIIYAFEFKENIDIIPLPYSNELLIDTYNGFFIFNVDLLKMIPFRNIYLNVNFPLEQNIKFYLFSDHLLAFTYLSYITIIDLKLKKIIKKINTQVYIKNLCVLKEDKIAFLSHDGIKSLLTLYDYKNLKIVKDFKIVKLNKLDHRIDLIHSLDNIILFNNFNNSNIIINYKTDKNLATRIIKLRPDVIEYILSYVIRNANQIEPDILKLVCYHKKEVFAKLTENILRSNASKEYIDYFFEQYKLIKGKITRFSLKAFTCMFNSWQNLKKLEEYKKAREFLKSTVLENPKVVSPEALESIYTYLNEKEKTEFKEKLKKIWGILPSLSEFINDGFHSKYPSNFNFLFSNTQSMQHAITHLETVREIWNKYSDTLSIPKIKKFLISIDQKEQQEAKIGNYTFYHGRNKDQKFIGEIFKELWKLKYNIPIRDDFIFLRYFKKEDQPDSIFDVREDSLFLNHALFGNAKGDLSGINLACSLTQYWLQNYSHQAKNIDILISEILNSFNYIHIYEKYLKEFKNLKDLHKQTSQFGEILMISVSADHVNNIKPVAPNGLDAYITINNRNETGTKKIIDELKKNPNVVKIDGKDSDNFEWILPLTKDFALNPQSSIKMYSFYLANEKKLDEYNKLKKEIFEKIAKDLIQEVPKIKSKL